MKYSEAAASLIDLGERIKEMKPEERAAFFATARKSGNAKVRAFFAEVEKELERLQREGHG